MSRRALIVFFAFYLSAFLVFGLGVAQASPWIASHILLKWML
ncbi:hypothetical protein PS858_05649 [Pseudomonas fluorescens]|jgi:predicted membrane-bound mannosyltransferase|uniref:Uncharacterized protein n=1 Tax=Pseudomonas fluorescens TaxID=294 RepID=A0A5E7AVW1_PSEFL|nr:hypothetical protein PS676_05933 [Pseudomonas fluorescens]VVN82350.1 hypothetical protein PS704_01193 [Pseudomonas fluorescens]VVP55557.1 hypothetical protein PS858_05649 [Pseudomonas fluorescens]